MKKSYIILILVSLFSFISKYSFAQTLPEVLEKGSLEEQREYMEERMNIYNGYRAVRDDIFLKMLKNSVDSLNTAKSQIQQLEDEKDQLLKRIEKINEDFDSTKTELKTAIENRDTLTIVGIPLSKTLYNVILLGIIAGLTTILILVLLLFQRNQKITNTTRKDLEEIKAEFEEYRKTSREKQEKMVIDHFNEIKKLKSGA